MAEIKNLEFYPAQTGNRINTTWPTMNHTYANIQFIDFSAVPALASADVEIELSTTNPNNRDIKMWFNLTGGNYTAPTGSNNLSWNQTTPRTSWTDSTYLNLTLTA